MRSGINSLILHPSVRKLAFALRRVKPFSTHSRITIHPAVSQLGEFQTLDIMIPKTSSANFSHRTSGQTSCKTIAIFLGPLAVPSPPLLEVDQGRRCGGFNLLDGR